MSVYIPVRVKKSKPTIFKNITLRVSSECYDKLSELANATNRSRNDIVNIFIEYGLKNYTTEEK